MMFGRVIQKLKRNKKVKRWSISFGGTWYTKVKRQKYFRKKLDIKNY